MHASRLFTLARDILAVVLPVALALLLAQQLSLHDQRNRATILAGVVLDRTNSTMDQIASAFQRMEAFDAASACSPEAIALMRQIDVGSTLLQGIGYVEGNALKCSSLDDTNGIDIGPADYRNASGDIVRRPRELSISPDIPMLVVTSPSGYACVVHPALMLSLTGDERDSRMGLVTNAGREPILSEGTDDIDWTATDMPDGQSSGVVTLRDRFVVWKRSARWDQFSYAAVPLSAASDEFASLAKLFVPAGAVAGLLVLFLIRRLAASWASLPTLLRQGLKRKEIIVVYQPIVDMATRRWVGAEVLARWRRRGGEWVSPDVFIPIAEKHGLIVELTRQVATQALDDYASLAQGQSGFFLSINVSAADLGEADFVPRLAAACRERSVPPTAVHLEVTERAEIDPEAEAEAIRTLRGLGFVVGIDDFGIGYSNLAYLDMLQLDYIKIDRAFVAAVLRDEFGTEMIDHIIAMASARGLDVIAEGVERAEQRTKLMARGVKLAQGWLFAKAMPRAAFAESFLAQPATGRARPPLARVA